MGSTSVPEAGRQSRSSTWCWKFATPADEGSYVSDLETAGYVLVIREPDWYEHRVFKGPDTNINLHVFSAGCEETRPYGPVPRLASFEQ